ncbi:MAG: sensor histidine kinase [Desulfobacter sp.]
MKFKIASRVISHLGSELISSDEIALYELVKNGFDAGSRIVDIDIRYKIDTHFIRKMQEHVFVTLSESMSQKKIKDLVKYLKRKILDLEKQDAIFCILEKEQLYEYAKSLDSASTLKELISQLGRINAIEISDEGHGMTKDEVEKYYLTVGTSHRLKQVKSIINTNSEKDIQPPSGEKGIGRLSSMRLGNTLEMYTISDNSPDQVYININWRDFTEFDYKDASEIPIENDCSDKGGAESGTIIEITDLKERWTKSKVEKVAANHLAKFIDPFNESRSQFKVNLKWNGKKIRFIERINQYLENCINSLHCKVYLNKGKKAFINVDYKFSEVKETPLTEFSRQYSMIDFNGLNDETMNDVGPFEFKLFHYPRNRIKAIPLVATRIEIKDWLDRWCGGLMVYRDGIRVLPYAEKDDDWLNLDGKALRGRGFRVNRIQVVGYVKISRIKNPNLIDQTNREGFQDNSTYRNFRNIILKILQGEFVHYLNEHLDKENADLQHISTQIDKEYNLLDACVNKIKVATDTKDWKLVKKSYSDLTEILKSIQETNSIVEQSLDQKQQNYLQVVELAATGMTAEAIAHDLEGVVETAMSSLREFSNMKSLSRRMTNSLKHIQSVHEVMLKQLNQISIFPTTKRRRAKKIDMYQFLKESSSFYQERMKRHNVECRLPKEQDSFSVKLVEGHLRQILDNLFRNSLYWLKETKNKFPEFSEKQISISLDNNSKKLTFYDSGIGINRTDRDWIFKQFHSRRDDGRGLGLYICKELALFNNLSIYLDTERQNEWRRLTTFNIDF